MKKTGLILGIGLMIISSLVLFVCLALPSMTNNRVSWEEALLGIIPSAFLFIVALAVTIISGLSLVKAKSSAAK
jgi:hypothetical protein